MSGSFDYFSSDLTTLQLSEGPVQSKNIIGYVTSGHYSLSVGRGQAMGVVSLARFLELKEQGHR